MWTDSLAAVRERFRRIGAAHQEETQRCWFAHEFPSALWRELGREGVFAAVTHGRDGPESGALWLAAAIEGLTYGTRDGGFVIAVLVHSVLGIGAIDRLGSEELRTRHLDSLASGQQVLAYAVTEPHGGTDPFNPTSRLTRSGDGDYRLDGAKWHITNLPFADLILVLCRNSETGELAQALIAADSPGVTRSSAFRLAGARTSPIGEAEFVDVCVPAAHVMHLGVRGAWHIQRALQGEKILASFGVVGVLDRVIDQVLGFVRGRSIRGTPLSSRQHLQRRLTDMQVTAETTRALAHAALARYAQGQDVALEAAALKLAALDGAIRTMIDAIQSCGAYGLQDAAFLHPILLDAITGSIGGGTEEAQRAVIFTEMVRRHARANRRAEVGG